MSGTTIVVGGVASVAGTLPVRLRLAPRVVLQHGDTFDATPVVLVPVLPCAMSIASGDALRAVDASRAVVRVDARCASEARTLRWFSAGRALDVLTTVDSGGATYLLLGVGRVEGDELVVTASRGDGSLVGQARVHARTLPPPRASLVLEGGVASIDFVPTNRFAIVRWTRTQGTGELALLPLEGVYDVTTRHEATMVQGQSGGGRLRRVSFRLARADPSRSAWGDDLAIITDPVERPMHEANVPAPLGASAMSSTPLVELLCGSGNDLRKVTPGASANVPFEEREACRLAFHGERLSPADGAQTLQLDVDVTRVDGTSRPEAHVSQTMSCARALSRVSHGSRA